MILDRFDLMEAEQSRALASAVRAECLLPRPIRVAFTGWVMMTWCLSQSEWRLLVGL